jgi:hypothetical protein
MRPAQLVLAFVVLVIRPPRLQMPAVHLPDSMPSQHGAIVLAEAVLRHEDKESRYPRWMSHLSLIPALVSIP